MRFVLATNNQHKLIEMTKILGEIGIEIVTMKQLGIDVDVVEDGVTFEENAIKKAKEICEICGEPSIADDSGLEVDYLGGAPGVYSARFAGDHDTQKNNEKLLRLLDGIPEQDRTARFVCVIAVAYPDGKVVTSRGECEGIILNELTGENGFGFDPLFYYPPYDKTFAQLSENEKNEVSHRGRALQKLKEILE